MVSFYGRAEGFKKQKTAERMLYGFFLLGAFLNAEIFHGSCLASVHVFIAFVLFVRTAA